MGPGKLRFFYPVVIWGIFLAGCSNNEKIAGFRLSTFYDDCTAQDTTLTGFTAVTDPNEKFVLSIPYNWNIGQEYTDTVYGMTAFNEEEAGQDFRKIRFLTVQGFSTPLSLKDYFAEEAKTIRRSKKMKIVMLGSTKHRMSPGYWVVFEDRQMQDPMASLVLYIRKENNDEIYLVQASVMAIEGYEERLCQMKKLMATFELQN